MKSKPYPPLTSEALAYTWRQLARRAGVVGGDPSGTGMEDLGVPVYYASPDHVQPERPGIIVVPCDDVAWRRLLKRVPDSLNWLPAHGVVPPGARLPFDDPVPLLFWGAGCEDGCRPFAGRREDGSLVFYADIIAATFFMLSRWEETVVPVRDQYERFPATASVAYKQSFLDRPVVDEYALILQKWLKALVPQWKPEPRRFAVRLSHDIDFIRRFPSFISAARMFGGDLLKRRSLKRAWQTAVDTVGQTVSIEYGSYLRGIYSLAELSVRHGMKSTFYFPVSEPGPFDSGYDPALPAVRQCIETLRRQGHELGFHAGYHTLNDPERLAAEKARLDAVLDETQYGGRQHYLRFRVPHTWRHWEQVGLTYDSTMGYADHEGFRCGTCHSFRPFDLEQNRGLDIWERPLIVMDQTLCHYRGFAPEEGKTRILELAQRCEQVDGTFTLLWHNSSLEGEWRPWAEAYRGVVKVLGQKRWRGDSSSMLNSKGKGA